MWTRHRSTNHGAAGTNNCGVCVILARNCGGIILAILFAMVVGIPLARLVVVKVWELAVGGACVLIPDVPRCVVVLFVLGDCFIDLGAHATLPPEVASLANNVLVPRTIQRHSGTKTYPSDASKCTDVFVRASAIMSMQRSGGLLGTLMPSCICWRNSAVSSAMSCL